MAVQVSTVPPEAEPLSLYDIGMTSPFDDIILGGLLSRNR